MNSLISEMTTTTGRPAVSHPTRWLYTTPKQALIPKSKSSGANHEDYKLFYRKLDELLKPMQYGVFPCPEWRGEKASEYRPCIIRQWQGGITRVNPCTSNQIGVREGLHLVGVFDRPSYLVLACTMEASTSEVDELGSVPLEVHVDILQWEFEQMFRKLREGWQGWPGGKRQRHSKRIRRMRNTLNQQIEQLTKRT